MLALSLRGDALTALADMPERMRTALSDRAGALAAELEAKVQQKLAGEALNARTGALARAIMTTVEDTPTGVVVRVGVSSSDVKYAAIHEYGGTIPPHEIVPDKSSALAFAIDGKQAFARRVNLPAVTTPERSYLRSSLAEMADEIGDEFAETMIEAMKDV